LTTRATQIESLSDEVYEKFIGGKGLGTYLLYKHLEAGIDPLGATNILFFLTGPLQGLPAPNVGRWTLVTKSPLTGLILDSHSGGSLGQEIKKSGYDAVCIKGVSANPVYIHIQDQNVKIESAEGIWGQGVHETTERLYKRHPKSSVYTIGPAGENLVRIATGCCEIAHQTGRGGAGAVMGSKNLKAIVVKGSKKIFGADVDTIRKINADLTKGWNQKENTDFKRFGSPFLVELSNEMGQFPTRNYETGYFDNYSEIIPEEMSEIYAGAHNSCPNCVMRCTHAYETTDPDNTDQMIESCIEYETIGLMGGNLGISNLTHLLQLNYLADRLGLDTISGGSVLGFAMDAYKQGILTDDIIGFSLNFGDGEAALKLLKMIAYREGIGAILSEGVRIAAEKIGHNSKDFAVHFKGLELPAWDPRGRRGLALSYATANVGGSHLRGWPSTTDPPDESAVDLVDSMVNARDQKVLTDSLVVCHFTYHLPLSHETKIQLLNAATGLHYDEEDAKLFGRRVVTLGRMFNHREGISRESDILPERMWIPEPSGPRKGMTSFINKDDFELCLDRYYELRGWSIQDGLPTTETLELLGLNDIV